MSKTAVITGATSGMGAAYAKRLAADGHDLILTGRRQEIIEKLADELKKKRDVNVNVIIAELSDDNDIQKVIDAIEATEDIEFLINNAGYSGYKKHFIDAETSDYEKMIKVHQIVPMRLISAVLPQMIRREKGVIINVSSTAAFTPMPEVGVYGATKSFLRFFSEVLYQEVRDKGIVVQALCPGYTDTNFGKDYMTEEEFNKMLSNFKYMTMSPEAVVEYSMRHLKKSKVNCIPGAKNKVMVSFFSSLPRSLYYKLTAKMLEM
ncbi:SDR family NAD(P)-dependent oxidoreductase [Chloroflexota bacterium]